jgi:hypothetical protein
MTQSGHVESSLVPRHLPLEYLLSRYPVVPGHFTFEHVSAAVLRNTFLFTVLREPVDRAVSLYYFYRAQATSSDVDPRVAVARTFDLAAFVRQLPERVSPWCNWQTFVFSGARNCEQPAHELLPAAIDNLHRMSLVGVSDELEPVIPRLAYLRRWPLCLPRTRVNMTTGRVPAHLIDPGITHRLAQLNDCDRRLFACARTLWKEAKSTPLQPHSFAAGSSVPFRPTISEHGTREIVITTIRGVGQGSQEADEVYVGECFDIRISAYSCWLVEDVTIGIRVDDHLGIEVYGMNTRLLELGIALTPGQTFNVIFSLNANLAPGIYHVTAAIHGGADHLHRCFHWIDNAVAFECRARKPVMFSGTSDLQASATFETVTERRAMVAGSHVARTG